MKNRFILFFLFLVLGGVATSAQDIDLYSTEKIHEIRITFKQKNWQEVLDSLKLNGEDVLIGKVNIDGKNYSNVGVRYRGAKSFKYGGDRNSFQIKLNSIDRGQNHQGYKRVKLSNALRDPSMVREVLGFEIARKYMHAPKASHTRLYVNGEYRGMFVNIEYIDDTYLETHFGSSDNTFFKCSKPDNEKTEEGCLNKVSGTLVYEEDAACYMNNYELKSENGWDDMIKLTKVLHQSPEKIGKYLDVDQVLWMHAFNNVLVNLNSYSGDYSENYYLYKDATGRFVPVVRDMNLCFGSYKRYKFRSSDLKLEELQTLDPMLHATNKSKPLISKLLANPYYKKVYVSHIKTILEDNFLEGQYEKRASELQRMISNDMFRDKYKYYDHGQFLGSLKNTTGKRSKIPGIAELMSKRTRFLKKHKDIRALAPTFETVTVKGREKYSNDAVESFKVKAKVSSRVKKVRIYYKLGDAKEYQMAYLKDDGKDTDMKAGDSLYVINIEPEEDVTTMEYYLVAENPATVAYYPMNYNKEPKTISLEELNK